MTNKNIIFNRIKGIGLILLGILLLAGAVFAFYYKFSDIRSFSEILPAESTIFFAEGDLKSAEEYIPNFRLVDIAKNILEIENFKTDIAPWLGDHGGVAILNPLIEKGNFATVYFAEISDLNRLNLFLEQKLIKMPFSVIDGYFVTSKNREMLSYIKDNFKSALPKLSGNQDFLQVKHNLSLFRLGFFYMKPNILSNLAFNTNILKSTESAYLLFQPFFTILNGTGGNITIINDGLFIQTYTNVNKKVLANRGLFRISKKYRAGLVQFIPVNNLLAFFGGQDIVKQFERISEIFKELNASSPNLFSKLLQSQFVQFLGDDLDFPNDVLPILSNEYSLSIHGTLKEKSYLIALQLNNPEIDRQRIEKLQKKFIALGGIFAPEVREIKLPDGTKGKELVAGTDKVEVSREALDALNAVITKIDIKGQKWGIYYTFYKNYALFASNLDLLKESISQKQSLWSEKSYKGDILRVISASDEVHVLNTKKILEEIGGNASLKNLFNSFSTITSSKNYFDDGISGIYFAR